MYQIVSLRKKKSDLVNYEPNFYVHLFFGVDGVNLKYWLHHLVFVHSSFQTL